MRNHLKRLSTRERNMVIGGGVFVALILGYLLIWAPINNKIDALQQDVLAKQELLTWMHNAARDIQQIQASGVNPQASGSLLVIVEKTLTQSQLSNSLTQVQQPQSDRVLLTFNKVPFDDFATWLQKLWRGYGINVGQITVSKSDEMGLVQAQVTLIKK